jgi:hypothetical protein
MATTPDPDIMFDNLAADLASRGAHKSKMFTMPCLKDARGKAFVGLRDGELVVRLGRDTVEHAAASKIRGAHIFQPRAGSAWQDWICIPPTSQAEWSRYASAALAVPR